MSPMFLFLGLWTLLGAAGAVGFRNPVHCALSLVVAFAGLAGVYLGLGAQFLGLAQVMVYIGAVSILVVFVLLVTRTPRGPGATERGDAGRGGGVWGAVIGAGGLAVVLGTAAWSAGRWGKEASAATRELPGVRQLGEALMTDYVVPLQVAGALLTAALIGAAILALREGRSGPRSKPRPGTGGKAGA